MSRSQFFFTYGVLIRIMAEKEEFDKEQWLDFIPEIYNYCDRWCEKCPKQMQCLNYVLGKRMEAKARSLKKRQKMVVKKFSDHIKNMVEFTRGVLQDLATERGVEMEQLCSAKQMDDLLFGSDLANIQKEGELYVRIENSDILRICKIYENWSIRCIGYFAEQAEQKGDEQVKRVKELYWYSDLLQAKIRKALYERRLENRDAQKGSIDYNGLVKLALISIDKSQVAWKAIQSLYAEHAREIQHLLVMLDQLQKDLEREFPKARGFVRPGLD